MDKKQTAVKLLSDFYTASIKLNNFWQDELDLNLYAENYPEGWKSFDEEVLKIVKFVKSTTKNLIKD